MSHGLHIYAKVYDMEKAKMCAYHQSYHALPHWKCVLLFCANFLYINVNDQETDNQYSDTTPSMRFHIYHIIARCSDHGIIPFKDRKFCCMCKQEPSSN